MKNKPSAEDIYQQLKSDILNNQLTAGSVLKQEQLSEKYGVSRIPIRDVLQRLKNEGWLAQSGKRGVMVHPLSADEAQDLYMMRQYIEPMLLEFAIPKLNHQTIGQATDILEKLDQSGLNIQQHGELNWLFHATLYQAAQRPTLFNTANHLHQLCARYIGFHSVELDYVNTSQQQHYDLLDAIRLKQVDKAKSILNLHIVQAGELLVTYLKQNVQD